MTRVIISAGLLLLVFSAYGNHFAGSIDMRPDTIYNFNDVDEQPEPMVGMRGLYAKWNAVVKYPVEARRKRIEGRVYIFLIIDEKGQIMESGIEKSLGYGCDEAAMEALKKIDLTWLPAIKDSNTVKVKVVLPFIFKLR